MRLTIPSAQMRTVRTLDIHGNTLKMVVRRVNQNPVYFVTYNGTVLHMGKRKHAKRMFNQYVPYNAVTKVQYLSI